MTSMRYSFLYLECFKDLVVYSKFSSQQALQIHKTAVEFADRLLCACVCLSADWEKGVWAKCDQDREYF